MSVYKYKKLAAVDLVTGTELNAMSIANNAGVFGATVIDNTQGQTSDGYEFCEFELKLNALAAAPAAGKFLLWLVRSVDGTNFETAGTGVSKPKRAPDVVFWVNDQPGTQRIPGVTRVNGWDNPLIRAPAGKFKPLLLADEVATGGLTQLTADDDSLLQISFVTRELP